MNPLINLAKKAVESYVKNGKIIEPPEDLPREFLRRRAGTFVTIEKNGELRGCIGTYLPVRKNIAEEIIYSAVAAATEDYRFGKIAKEEFSDISYTIYILNEPESIKDISELNPKKYGIIIKTAPTAHSVLKCGLLLPDIEGVDTIEQQISIACQKGGIYPEKEQIMIFRFTAEKYGQ